MQNDLLANFIQEINHSNNEVNKISVIKGNHKIAEYSWKENRVQNMHSIAKTLVSMAVGFVIEEYSLTIDHSVAQLFSEYIHEKNKEILSQVTLHHLLSLSLGQGEPYLMMDQRNMMKEEDWITYVLNRPFKYKAGENFLYSNTGPYLSGVAVERYIEAELSNYLKEKVFHPLGIKLHDWEKDPLGHTFGAGGVFLTPKDFERLILLLLNDGKYEGEKILPEHWVEVASTPHIELNPENGYATHYGYGLWIDERTDSFRADGAFGQLGIIFRSKNSAVIVSSNAADNESLLEKIYRLIYPKL